MTLVRTAGLVGLSGKRIGWNVFRLFDAVHVSHRSRLSFLRSRCNGVFFSFDAISSMLFTASNIDLFWFYRFPNVNAKTKTLITLQKSIESIVHDAQPRNIDVNQPAVPSTRPVIVERETKLVINQWLLDLLRILRIVTCMHIGYFAQE